MKPTVIHRLAMAAVAMATCATAGAAEPGGAEQTGEPIEHRAGEYDAGAVPEPGGDRLPVLRSAADGVLLGADGEPVRLHELARDCVVVLSFIYTRCADPKACLRATGALNELQKISRNHPELAERLLLLTLSFDPGHDSPEVMAGYGRVAEDDEDSSPWLFLTAPGRRELQPLLKAYGQRVGVRRQDAALGPYTHPLRVYLIDPRQRIRSIYNHDRLDPHRVAADALTLLREADAGDETRADDQPGIARTIKSPISWISQ